MVALSPSQKGASAEAEISAAAIRLGLIVLRPLSEGGRYDLVIDTGDHLIRVQCKWAARHGAVLNAYTVTSRHTPRGYVRSTYSAAEVDAIGVFASDPGECYLLPIAHVAGHRLISLRIAPTGNNQASNVRWASHYELEVSLRRHWGWRDCVPEPAESGSVCR